MNQKTEVLLGQIALLRSYILQEKYAEAALLVGEMALDLVPVDALKGSLTDEGAQTAEKVADAAEAAKLASEGKESAESDGLPPTEPAIEVAVEDSEP